MNIYIQDPGQAGYQLTGKNNRIIIVVDGSERLLLPNEIIDGLSLEIKGNNNFIKLESPINFQHGSAIKILNNNTTIEIGSSPFFKLQLRCSLGDGQLCKIQRNTVMVDVAISLEGNTELYIGEDCLFSDGPIYIRPCDGHSIIDIETDNLVNLPVKPIIIGNHCWLGNSCKIIRGAQIPDNTIVGMGALVNKAFDEEYTILAGVPAKIIKRKRKWDMKNPYFYC